MELQGMKQIFEIFGLGMFFGAVFGGVAIGAFGFMFWFLCSVRKAGRWTKK